MIRPAILMCAAAIGGALAGGTVANADPMPGGRWREAIAVEQITAFLRDSCAVPVDGADLRRVEPQAATIDGDGEPDYYADVPTELVSTHDCKPQSLRFTWLSSEGFSLQPPNGSVTAHVDAPPEPTEAPQAGALPEIAPAAPPPPTTEAGHPPRDGPDEPSLEATSVSRSADPFADTTLAQKMVFLIATLGLFLPVSILSWKLGRWFRDMSMPDVIMSKNLMQTFYLRIFWSCGPQIIALGLGTWGCVIAGALAVGLVK